MQPNYPCTSDLILWYSLNPERYIKRSITFTYFSDRWRWVSSGIAFFTATMYWHCSYFSMKWSLCHMMCNTWKGPLCNLWTMQALISLPISAGWSGPLLSAYRTSGYCSTLYMSRNRKCPDETAQMHTLIFFFFFFDLGFTALSRIFHLNWANCSSKVGENQRTRGTRAVVGQRSSPAGYILYCNIFIIKKFKMK